MNLKEFAKSLNGRKFYSVYGPLYESEFVDNCYDSDIIVVSGYYDGLYNYNNIHVTNHHFLQHKKDIIKPHSIVINKSKFRYKKCDNIKKYNKYSSDKIIINIHYIDNILYFDTNIDNEKFYLLDDNDALKCIGMMFHLNQ